MKIKLNFCHACLCSLLFLGIGWFFHGVNCAASDIVSLYTDFAIRFF